MLERGVFVMALVGERQRAVQRLFEAAGKLGIDVLRSFEVRRRRSSTHAVTSLLFHHAL